MVRGRVRSLVRRILPHRLRSLAAGLRPEKVLVDTRTPFNHLRVVDKGGKRYLVFVDHSPRPVSNRPEHIYQSCMCLKNPVRSTAPYLDFFHLPFLFQPDIRRVLMIGLGGGTAARQFLADYPALALDAVEIDAEVARVAREYFGLPDDPRLAVHVEDGRNFARRPGPEYDLVVLDAFFARTVPHHLTTVEFLWELCARLAPRGLVTINVNGALEGPRSKLFRRMHATFSTVFPEVYVFARRRHRPAEYQNIALVAARTRTGLSASRLQRRARRLENDGVVKVPGFAAIAACVYEAPLPGAGVEPLTDRRRPPGGMLDIYGR